MSDLALASRRQALKFISVILPLGSLSAASAAASVISGCRSEPNIAATKTDAHFVSASFTSMPAPTLSDPAAMASTTVASLLNVTLSDDTTLSYQLAYHPFFVTGDMVADGNGGRILSGGYVDIHNQAIIDRSVVAQERQFFSDCPDGCSLLSLPNPSVAGIQGKAVFAVVQFEYATRDLSGADAYGMLPSPVAVLSLDQNQSTGQLTLVKYHNVDTSNAHGLWITCGASLSPWNTHLSSEEYQPDAPFIADNQRFKAFSRHLFGSASTAKPYHYGHLPEVTVHPDGSGTVKKHYCLGRISHELIQVMPDQRTALMGDDYTNSGLFMFVADKAQNLSSGTLYVARIDPGFSLDTNAAGAALRWIKLGHATSAEIEHLADTLSADDIMSARKTDPLDAGYTKVFVNGIANWIKLKPGMEKAAAFLETHRYASLKGGSMAFSKMEGTTVNAKDKIAYSALANIQDSMIVNGNGWYPAANIALPKKCKAGGILAHNLAGAQHDSDGDAIDSEWVPVLTKALLLGEDIAADALGNTAHADKIASPDNLKFSEKLRTLFIGEDSGNHVNNFLWAYHVDTQRLSRILSTPAGAESTGLHAVDDINGWTYIMSNFQHPGDWTALHAKVQSTLDPLIRANYKDRYGAAVGYLTADPVGIKLR